MQPLFWTQNALLMVANCKLLRLENTIDCKRHWTVNGGILYLPNLWFVIARCLKILDISFNTKCLLVWCDLLVITWLVQTIFGINHHRNFWKFWNCSRFTRAISKFSKMHLGSLSLIALPEMWLLVQILQNFNNSQYLKTTVTSIVWFLMK